MHLLIGVHCVYNLTSFWGSFFTKFFDRFCFLMQTNLTMFLVTGMKVECTNRHTCICTYSEPPTNYSYNIWCHNDVIQPTGEAEDPLVFQLKSAPEGSMTSTVAKVLAIVNTECGKCVAGDTSSKCRNFARVFWSIIYTYIYTYVYTYVLTGRNSNM